MEAPCVKEESIDDIKYMFDGMETTWVRDKNINDIKGISRAMDAPRYKEENVCLVLIFSELRSFRAYTELTLSVYHLIPVSWGEGMLGICLVYPWYMLDILLVFAWDIHIGGWYMLDHMIYDHYMVAICLVYVVMDDKHKYIIIYNIYNIYK